jgi:hypothetical protein
VAAASLWSTSNAWSRPDVTVAIEMLAVKPGGLDAGESCHLSHIAVICLAYMAGTTGLEPATSAVTGQRSNQLSYVPRRRINRNTMLRRLNSLGRIPHRSLPPFRPASAWGPGRTHGNQTASQQQP